jgi:hypothetical protein
MYNVHTNINTFAFCHLEILEKQEAVETWKRGVELGANL